VGQVKKIVQNPPNQLELLFFIHDLSLLTDICDKIKEISDKNQLNKSKNRTLLDIKKESKNAFQYIINANTSVSDTENKEAQQSSTDDDCVSLANMRAKKNKQIADKIIRKEIQNQLNSLKN
jgi:ABC-type oligopeptide transport system ATPase subunit